MSEKSVITIEQYFDLVDGTNWSNPENAADNNIGTTAKVSIKNSTASSSYLHLRLRNKLPNYLITESILSVYASSNIFLTNKKVGLDFYKNSVNGKFLGSISLSSSNKFHKLNITENITNFKEIVIVPTIDKESDTNVSLSSITLQISCDNSIEVDNSPKDEIEELPGEDNISNLIFNSKKIKTIFKEGKEIKKVYYSNKLLFKK